MRIFVTLSGGRKYTIAGSEDEIMIYVFSPEEIDILEELDFANSIVKKYDLNEFWVSRYEDSDDKFKDVFLVKCSSRRKINNNNVS